MVFRKIGSSFVKFWVKPIEQLCLLIAINLLMNMSRIYCLILIFFMSFGFTAKAQDSRSAAIGDVIVFALPAATIATTLIIGDTQGTWQFAKGLILTEGITFGLKALVDKNRPDMSDQNSFPSGHASSTFHSASFIHQRYGITYAIPAYALATLTGLTRIHGEKHDGFDVLIGAVIGIGSAYLFTTPYQKEHIEITFSSDSDNYQFGFKFKY